jgi:phosphoribosyl 1,2-cyclic phosphodiesterase
VPAGSAIRGRADLRRAALRLAILGSGSEGNALFLEASGFRVLVDAGFSCRELEARLTGLGVDPARIDLILLSHEHGDHAKGAIRFAQRFRCPVAANRGTLRCLGPGVERLRVVPMEAGKPQVFGAWRVTAVRVPHDAVDPVAFRLETPDGSVGYALDLGHAPEPVRRALESCEVLIVEANHDPDLLEQGPYPAELKQRLAGPRGHLSNDEAGRLIADVATRTTRSLVLAHLSRINNRESLAKLSARRALGSLSGAIRMTVAEQGSAGWIET